MKKKWLLAGFVVVALAAGGGAWRAGVFTPPAAGDAAQGGSPVRAWLGKFGKGAKKPDVPLEFVAREVVQPAWARLPTTIEFSGPLVAPQTVVLRAKASGSLVALHVAEGSRVSAGQAVGRIDMADVASRAVERNAMLASARAALVQAEHAHSSNERLAQQNFISPIALENSRAALDTARANLNAAQAALETLRVGLRDAVLLAPIGGIVAKRHVLAGEKLSVEQPVVTIVNLGTLELAGNVGSHEVGRLSAGMPAQVQVEGTASPVVGRIARIAPAAEPGTRSIGVTIVLDNPKEQLRAGLYAVARTVLPDEAERLTLPATAVGHASGQDHVWLIENGLLARRAVTLGRRDGREGRVEVLQGVGVGSIVLAARFDNLREGAKATVVVAKSAPVASAAASTPALQR